MTNEKETDDTKPYLGMIRLVKVQGFANLIGQQFDGTQWRNVPRIELSESEVEIPEGIEKQKPRRRKKPAPKPSEKPQDNVSRSVTEPSKPRRSLAKNAPLGRLRR
jgi:hypothetical protein